jgi:hypothetical protein
MDGVRLKYPEKRVYRPDAFQRRLGQHAKKQKDAKACDWRPKPPQEHKYDKV